MQTDLFDLQPPFENSQIRKHNNSDSDKQATDHSVHFGNQTKWVFNSLMKGRELNGDIAKDEFGIRDLRARIFTLKKMEFKISDKTIPGAKGMKMYYMTKDEQFYNYNFIKYGN